VAKKDNSSIQNRHALPDRVLAGFLDINSPSSMMRVDFSKARKDGYNVVVVGYAKVSGENIEAISAKSLVGESVSGKIKEAQENGFKILLAVGGTRNSFHPGSAVGNGYQDVIGRNMSEQQIHNLASNIVGYIHKNNLDGISFNIKKYTSPVFLDKLVADIKQMSPNLIIAVEPKTASGYLITSGISRDYDLAIRSGNIDYIFIQEYNLSEQYKKDYIVSSYKSIIDNTDIPLTTKIIIVEPVAASAASANSIYHPDGDPGKSLSTEQAASIMREQFNELKYKPRFAGVMGVSLNMDYAANMYGDNEHRSGSFAKSLRTCIYSSKCVARSHKRSGPIIAGTLFLEATTVKIGTDNISLGMLDISMPKNEEFCDKYPSVCKYNIIVLRGLKYNKHGVFSLPKVYSESDLKEFIEYMQDKDKAVVLSLGDGIASKDWENIDFDGVESIVKKYGFDGMDIDLRKVGFIPTLWSHQIMSDVSNKIINMKSSISRYNHNFILTFSDSWSDVIPHFDKSYGNSIFGNLAFISLIESVGSNNIDYMFVKVDDKSKNSAIGSDKDREDNRIHVSFANGYSRFAPVLAWALTTTDGSNANEGKYKQIKPLILPPNKLVFVVDVISTPNPRNIDIQKITNIMSRYGTSFGGFIVDSIDSDMYSVSKDEPPAGYSHVPWSTTESISTLTLADVKNNFDSMQHVIQHQQKRKTTVSTDSSYGILYPNNIGAYNASTKVFYNGRKYRCISTGLGYDNKCNISSNIPGSLFSKLVWEKTIILKSKPKKTKKIKPLDLTGDIKYPHGIGHYKSGMIVLIGDQKFECMAGEESRCNNYKFSPDGQKGYVSWIDITHDVDERGYAHSIFSQDYVSSEYIYPVGIGSYIGGTTVSVDGALYRCKSGHGSELCSSKAYNPTGPYGEDVWDKIEKK
jgi:chitinase